MVSKRVMLALLVAVAMLFSLSISAFATRMDRSDFDERVIVEDLNDYKRVFKAVSEKPALDFDGWRIVPVVEPYMIAPPRSKRGTWHHCRGAFCFGSLDEQRYFYLR